jgi:hypothetical protein
MKRRHLRTMFLVLVGVAGAQAATAPKSAQGEGVKAALVTFAGEAPTEPPPFEPQVPARLPQPTLALLPGDSSNGAGGAGNAGGSGGLTGLPGAPGLPDLGLGGAIPAPAPSGFGGQGGPGGGAVPIASRAGND